VDALWLEIAPFAFSSGLSLFGSPLGAPAFRRLEREVAEEIDQNIGGDLERKALCEDVITPTVIRDHAEVASALASLPHKAMLTALGFSVLLSGPLASVVVVAAVVGSLGMQSRLDALGIAFRNGCRCAFVYRRPMS
jgi:hypothetical protein